MDRKAVMDNMVMIMIGLALLAVLAIAAYTKIAGEGGLAQGTSSLIKSFFCSIKAC